MRVGVSKEALTFLYFAVKSQPQFENRSVRKTYLARVHGNPESDSFRCDARIADKPAENGLRLIDPTGHDACTDFRVLQRLNDGTTMLEVSPLTGRTNQIRVHLWHLGLPIVGDPAYLKNSATGSNSTLAVDAPPMCLHALSIELHDQNGELRVFQSPPPKWADRDA